MRTEGGSWLIKDQLSLHVCERSLGLGVVMSVETKVLVLINALGGAN